MSELPRRDFLRLSAVAMASPFASSPAFAGPFEPQDAFPVPADKRLSPGWVTSLFAPGEPTVYRKSKDELKFIGMPVGGLFCGTLYLAGDGRLWLWDVFNDNREGVRPGSVHWEDGSWQGSSDFGPTSGAAYVKPLTPQPGPLSLFATIDGAKKKLEATDWTEVEFTGRYPIGRVRYTDAASPIQVDLEAFSPFAPLDLEDSSLPCTVVELTATNHGAKTTQVDLGGELTIWGPPSDARLERVVTSNERHATHIFCQGHPSTQGRPNLLIDDFQRDTYAPWTVTGTAFGTGPIRRKAVPDYQGDLGGRGDRIVNSHASAPGSSIAEKDGQTGRLVSPEFKIERDFIDFEIGGGSNANEVYVGLEIDGSIVVKATGHNSNHMRPAVLDVRPYQGKMARLVVNDSATGPWGNIGVDRFEQTDHPHGVKPVEKLRDFGSMAWAPLDGVGPIDLAPGKSVTRRFVLAWYFPNVDLPTPDASSGRHYARRFRSALDVANYVAAHYDRLAGQTKKWVKTWYDSTLPQWFLDRTMANTSILATTTAHRFATGRFWAWEGIGCCAGTCTHVWHYAQAPGRLFPALERDHRERVDFGVGFDERTGIVRHRGEGTGPAIDGECGRILGVLREHQMSPDDAFLRRIWPHVKRATEYLMGHDADGDGLIDGAQENTLDAAWFGKIAWISSLYLAALRASETMARTVGDASFAERCSRTADRAKHAIETELFDGEYFIQKAEPGKEASLGTYRTCHIDQVHGQSWAWQVGLGQILDGKKTRSALHALYRYNFAPDVGPFRKKNKEGRAYAIAGDGGLIMATNPRGLASPFGNAKDWQYGYFNECMSGFEHQAASHMIAEGLVLEGLAVTRAIHDRYHAKRRNPYNEIECSDHYSRAMASYGSFVTACGFRHDGPAGFLAFDPKIHPENFRCAFVTCEGWGTYSQMREGDRWVVKLSVESGRLRLSSLEVAFGAKTCDAHGAMFDAAQRRVSWASPVVIEAGASYSLRFV